MIFRLHILSNTHPHKSHHQDVTSNVNIVRLKVTTDFNYICMATVGVFLEQVSRNIKPWTGKKMKINNLEIKHESFRSWFASQIIFTSIVLFPLTNLIWIKFQLF